MTSSSSAAPIPAKRLQGKVAIITGGARGFGECTARLFLQHGANVIIADIQDDLGHALCKEFDSADGTISYVHCDVTSDSDVKNVVDFAMSKYGKLDIMFNNAGVGGNIDPSISDVNNEDFKKVIEVNIYGSFLGAKHAARVMIPAKRGVILFTASAASVMCGETPHAYTASKHATVGLMKNLCVELGQYGIRVNCISPSWVATQLPLKAMGIDKKTIEELVCASANLKGVVMTPEDVAEAALFLSGDASRYVSGLNLVIDGGYSISSGKFSMALKSLP